MAEAVVSGVLELLVSGVGQLIQEELKLVAGVGDEVRKFTTDLQFIQVLLADAERRQFTEAGVRVWLEKLKDVSYDMDDVLDTWNTASMKRLQLEGSNDALTLKSKVCSCFLFPYSGLRQVSLSHDIASKIKAIAMRLDDIAKWKDIFNFKLTVTSEQHQRVESTSFIDVSDVYGLDKEVNTLVSKLLGESSEQSHLHVISIVGMGGIGKTTLAKLAYNNDEVKNHFEKSIWVCVSNPFDELMIAKVIYLALGGDGAKLGNFTKLESVMQEIYKLITGKKFLIVLDDVWMENSKEWEPFHDCLKKGLHGSKILVTTRKHMTARMMESIDIIPIDELSNEKCWTIFSRFAFFGRTPEESKELEEIGRKIASTCKGLPLVAKTLGSLLRFKSTKKEWENILYSEMWEVQGFEEGVFASLLLSYYNLPFMVKRCFTYCAMFPKGFSFVKDELIRLWMAQGYLGLDHNRKIEIVGEEYFNVLAMHSLFQEFEKDDDGSIIRCRMHDIVHDVAQFLSKNECCMIEAKDLKERNIHTPYEKARQLKLTVHEGDTLPISICNFKKLQSLVIAGYSLSGAPKVFRKVISKLFEELTCLKALQICCFIDKPISKEIGKLLHLRYLDLSDNFFLRKLSESLCQLYNLQTLKLDRCYNLKVLPQGMGKLINLCHLMNSDTFCLVYMPKGIERLTKLRTLTEFHLSGGDYSGKACSLEYVNNIRHVEYLCLKDLKNSREVGQLENCKSIRQLELAFSWKDRKNDDEAILEAFQPPPNLQQLTIRQYRAESMSSLSRMTSLTNLRSISLMECTKCFHLPPLGKLSSLETLYIDSMWSVREVGNEFVGVERDDTSSSSSIISFPKLKTLYFAFMSDWEVWDFGIEDDTTITFMPSLHTLKLTYCPKLKGLPKQLLEKAPLQNLSIEDCPILQQVYEKGKGDKWDHISHIPNIDIQIEDPI